jgi:hypothetical protein
MMDNHRILRLLYYDNRVIYAIGFDIKLNLVFMMKSYVLWFTKYFGCTQHFLALVIFHKPRVVHYSAGDGTTHGFGGFVPLVRTRNLDYLHVVYEQAIETHFFSRSQFPAKDIRISLSWVPQKCLSLPYQPQRVERHKHRPPLFFEFVLSPLPKKKALKTSKKRLLTLSALSARS